ncbi:MAG TPA: AAA family ATPase [Actinomycetota bacterium]|nr:AAA family ATPase [Actinomycetota bacterium]
MSDRGLVGREDELDELRQGLENALSGRGQLFLLAGEAGIGKSRLSEEIAREARDRGARVLMGRCWEAGGAPPYWPWVQAFRAALRDLDHETIRSLLGVRAPHLAQMLPEVLDAFDDLSLPTGLDPESARFHLFDAAATFVRNAARQRPLVGILDDLHAADEPSLLLLRFIAQEVAEARVLIVATYRDTEMRRGLAAAVADLVRQPTTRRRSLTGLSLPQVEELIESTTTIRPPAPVSETIYQETEGNPLFVAECARLLAAEGSLTNVAGATVTIKVPESVREVIERRLRHLSGDSRELLAMASVLGRDFALDPLLSLDGRSPADALDLLDEALRTGVAVEVPGSPGTFRFAHALIRDTLYDEIPPKRRMELHGRIGDALEDLYGETVDPPVAEMAHHFFRAARVGWLDKALPYLRRAAALAASRLAYEEAARHAEMALNVLDLKRPPDETTRCEVLLQLGDALARAGDAEGAKDAFLRGAEIARVRGMSDQLAHAALGYGGRFVWEAGRGDPHLLPLLEDALSALENEQSPLRARLMARLAGGPLRDELDRERRAEMSRRAVELARQLGDPATLAYVLDGRYAAVWWPDNLHERLQIGDEFLAAAENAEDKERLLQARHYRCLAFLEMGQMQRVYQELDEKRRLAEELHQPAQRWYVVSVEACLAVFQGRFEEAETLIDDMFQLGRRVQGDMAEPYMIGQLYSLRRLQGRLSEVEPTLNNLTKRFTTYPVLACELAETFAELGHRAKAGQVLSLLAEDDFSRLPKAEEWIFGMTLLSDTATILGDRSKADALYERLRPYADRNALSAPDACSGSVERNLGELARVLDRFDEAERHFGAALARNEEMGATPWVAMTQHHYGAMLLSSGSETARPRAIELLRASLETARTLGMSSLTRATAKSLGDVGESVPWTSRTTRTFMFTDIVKSTPLLEAIGDEAWENLKGWHDRTLRSLFSRHGGDEVDHAGDGFFIAFSDPQRAVNCAIAIQQALADHRRQQGFAPFVRIGVHTAEAMETAEGYGGRGVHEAARIGSLADANEIVASRRTAEELSEFTARNARTVELKGVSEPVEVVNIDW